MAEQAQQLSSQALIHVGFQDLAQAREGFAALRAAGMSEGCMDALFQALTRVCDPDIALQHLTMIRESFHNDGVHLHDLLPDPRSWATLVSVLGASEVMGVLMRTRPDLLECAASSEALPTAETMRSDMLAAVAADDATEAFPVSRLSLADGTTHLRAQYLRTLAHIMARDTTASDPVNVQPMISRALSDLASAALEAALAVARGVVDEAKDCRFTVIGMGKLGARELNYVSDVDLIYVVEPVEDSKNHQQLVRAGSKLASILQKVCQSVVPGVREPSLWQIDTALRPEGKDGPLVRTLQSHQDYYQQWAQNWEFQALLKARPVAGDRELGKAYYDMAQQFVWKASQRENFVYDCQ
ncbi:MAG: bifunctional [glutamine synthetase] adenylyltransferase/[glutamine synthetase]-adenylyl-L-tyrosine phosphorylase, partial [Bifidobacterium psychraerophilum]